MRTGRELLAAIRSAPESEWETVLQRWLGEARGEVITEYVEYHKQSLARWRRLMRLIRLADVPCSRRGCRSRATDYWGKPLCGAHARSAIRLAGRRP